MTKFYAQPYDISASGFFFETMADYDGGVSRARNAYGQIVEEFEIQLIDAETIDCQLFEALGVNQCTIGRFIEAVADWDETEKTNVIIAVGEVGHAFDLGRDDPNNFQVDLYACESFRDLAMQFVDDGLFGDIPASIQNYVDYDAIGRDLAIDYSEIVIAGTCYIYRCD